MSISEKQLTECEKEPIHQLAAIQRFGCLFLVAADTNLVLAEGSDNRVKSLGYLLDDKWPVLAHLIDSYRNVVGSSHPPPAIRYERFSERAKQYVVQLHLVTEGIIAEVTPEDQNWSDELKIMSDISTLFSKHQVQSRALHDDICTYIATLTGYERVMLYLFDASGSGEVLGETKPDSMLSYRFHHFPASDIPQQARALYVKNPARFIISANQPSVPIAGHKINDLSFSALRAVSPVHIEYLKNMGVEASMSISIVLDGQLAGLVACHHSSSKLISISNLRALKQLSMAVSLEFSHLFTATYFREREALTNQLKKIAQNYLNNRELRDTNNTKRQLLRQLSQLFDCGNIVYFDKKQTLTAWPSEIDFRTKLAPLLHSKEYFESESLSVVSDTFMDHQAYLSGAVGIKLSDSAQIWLLRAEEPKTIKWGGKPAKESTNGVISPRKSFETWKTIQKGVSKPWKKAITDVAREVLLENYQKWFCHQSSLSFSELDQLDICSIVADPNQDDMPIVFVNKTFTKLYGYEIDEVIGKNPRFLNSGKIIPDNSVRFHKSLEQELPFPIMTTDYTKSGEPIEVMVTISPHYDKEGKLQYFVSSQFDIGHTIKSTQHWTTELAESIVNTQNHLITVIEDNKVEYANKAFLDFFACSKLKELKAYITDSLSDLFVAEEDCFTTHSPNVDWVSELSSQPESDRIVAFNSEIFGLHFFNVSVTAFNNGRSIVVFTDITTSVQEKRSLKQLAMTDPLTGAKNRTHFEREVTQKLRFISNQDKQVAIAMLDIDFFKQINDTYGHSVGDEVLSSLTESINRQIREEDWLIRWGGEEFLLLMGVKTPTAFEKILQGICDQVSSETFGSQAIKLTISIGAVLMQHGENIYDSIEQADEAMYRSKQTGRNKITFR